MYKLDKFFSQLQMFGIKLGLEQTRELFDRLGKPEVDLKFIHIAGTNGKGSVATMLLSSLMEMGYKVGLYTSPHLISVRERFRINGEAISEKKLEQIISKVEPILADMKCDNFTPTYFEVTTAIAATYFTNEDVDFVLWECGLGGRFDSTNIITPIASIITSIGKDHTAHLGDTFAKIANEKGGIIKNNIPIFCSDIPKNAKTIIKNIASDLNAPLSFTKKEELKCELRKNVDEPIFQTQNRILATKIVKFLSQKYQFDYKQAISAISNINWPGRFQILNPTSGFNNPIIAGRFLINDIIIDGAHNPQAIKLLVKALKKKFPNEKFSILFAAFADKDSDKSLKRLATIADEFILTEVDTGRKTSPVSTLEAIIKKHTSCSIRKVKSPEIGLTLSRRSKLLVTGSLYLVGEILKEIIPEKEILNLRPKKK